jgi:tRNA1(Val) A37 N6-methylase TrmN6
MLTAWVGARELPKAKQLLDLGSGIGSVGLMALYRMSENAKLTMVEAQEISHRLARRAISVNGLEDRVRARLGDLRDPASIPPEEEGSYDLVLGSPPYLPLGTGIVSPHPQKAACRFELRGDVSDYCMAAARALAPEGVFAMVHSAQDARPEPAIEAAGLTLLCRQEVYFRRDKAPVIALFVVGWEGDREDRDPVIVREADGSLTDSYQQIRLEMGAPIHGLVS